MGRFARGLFGGQLFKDEKSLAEMLDFRELTRLEGVHRKSVGCTVAELVEAPPFDRLRVRG
jgi:hypothetical protein